MGEMVNEKAIVNAVVGLLATGGSTNHAIHIPAMARAAGIIIDWQDMDELSAAVPLIARVYPNGSGDVNHFHAAGGMGFVIKELLGAGLAHADILTISENGMADFATEPFLEEDKLVYRPAPDTSGDAAMLRPVLEAFLPDGGMRLVQGNLGRATFKSSAVDKERWTLEAPIRVFDTQEGVQQAFKNGELEKDVIVVVRFQGPRANGMPELHKLTRRSACFRTRGSRWRWSPMAACRAHRARSPPPSMSRPRRWPIARRVRPAGLSARWRHRARLRRNGPADRADRHFGPRTGAGTCARHGRGPRIVCHVPPGRRWRRTGWLCHAGSGRTLNRRGRRGHVERIMPPSPDCCCRIARAML
jgi:hypothetical protein